SRRYLSSSTRIGRALMSGRLPGLGDQYARAGAAVAAMTNSGEREGPRAALAERQLGRVGSILGGAVDRVGHAPGGVAPRVVGHVGLRARRAPEDEEL